MCQASICFVAVLRISGVNEPGSERASRVSESVRKIGTNVLLYAFAIMQKNEWREKSAERHWKSAAGGIICERVNERVRKWDRERGREWGECGKKRGKKPNTFKKSYNFVMVFFLLPTSSSCFSLAISCKTIFFCHHKHTHICERCVYTRSVNKINERFFFRLVYRYELTSIFMYVMCYINRTCM